jgi:flagellar biosynthesis/type III secretory pathway chaperone
MANTMNELQEVLSTEIELGEALLNILRQQQQSLVSINAGLFAQSLEKEQTLLELLQSVEKERVRLSAEVSDVPGLQSPAPRHRLIVELEERLKPIVTEILNTNQINKSLLEHSKQFIHETLRIITDDYSRQLVDHRI